MSKRPRLESSGDSDADVRSLLLSTLGQVQELDSSGGGDRKAVSITVAFDDDSKIFVRSNEQKQNGSSTSEEVTPKPASATEQIINTGAIPFRQVVIPVNSHQPCSASNDYVDAVAREHKGKGSAHLVWFDGHKGSCKWREKDRSNDWDEMDVTPPPPPPKDLHEKYGIGTNHADLSTAIEACQSGDIIYIMKTKLDFEMDNEIHAEKAVTIIGLGRTPDGTVLIRNDSSISIDAKVSFRNLTLQFGHRGSYGIQNDDTYELAPFFHLREEMAQLHLDRCVFDMGSASAFEASRKIMRNRTADCGLPGLHQSIISGIHVQTARSVIIEQCRFLGGCGSALTVICDPLLPSPQVKVTGSTFEGMCQPPMELPAEAKDKNCRKSYSKKVEKMEEEAVPLPAVVEVWSIERKRKTAKMSRPDICLQGNSFQNNLRCPIAYRVISDGYCLKGDKKDEKRSFVLCRPSRRGRDDGATHIDLEEVDVVVQDNTVVNNGLALGGVTLSVEESGRATSTEDKGDSGKTIIVDPKSAPFPDGDSVLIAGTFKEEISRGWSEDSDIFAPLIYYDREHEELCYGEEHDY